MFKFNSSSGADEAGQGSPLFGGGSQQDSPRSRRSQQSSNGRGGGGRGRRGGFPFGFGKRRSTDSPSDNGAPPKRTPPVSPFDDDDNLRILSGVTLGQRQAATLKKVKELYADDELDRQSYRINQIKILQSHLGALDYDGLHESAKNMGTTEKIEGVEVDEDGELFIDVQELRGTLLGWLKNAQFEKLALALKAPPQSNGASSSSSADAEMKYAPPASSSSSSSNHQGASNPMSPESENDDTMRDVISLLDSTQSGSVQPSTSAASRELELAIHEYLKGQQAARVHLLNSKFAEACSTDPALLTFAQSLRVEIQPFALDSKDKVVVPARMTSLNISADVNFIATIHFVGGKSFNCFVAMATHDDTAKLVDVYAALFELQAPSSSSSALSSRQESPVVSSAPITEKISVPELMDALDVGAAVPDSLLKDVLRAFCRVCVANLF